MSTKWLSVSGPLQKKKKEKEKEYILHFKEINTKILIEVLLNK